VGTLGAVSAAPFFGGVVHGGVVFEQIGKLIGKLIGKFIGKRLVLRGIVIKARGIVHCFKVPTER